MKQKMQWRALALAIVLATSCANPQPNARTFERWQSADTSRAAAFARFEALLRNEGVLDVVPTYELWLVDRLRPACAASPFVEPPEAEWRNIAPALRFIRDHVKPAIGDVRVVSAYRDEAFNTCIGGAPRSAHRNYYALDLVPVDGSVDRAALISALCPIHDREGPDADIGLGIYSATRFHIDARGYRGWGGDHRGATFPCRS